MVGRFISAVTFITPRTASFHIFLYPDYEHIMLCHVMIHVNRVFIVIDVV